LTDRLNIVLLDFILRLLIVEKHVALKYVEAGYSIPGFEAPGYISLENKLAALEKVDSEKSIESPSSSSSEMTVLPSVDPALPPSRRKVPWLALGRLFTNPRCVTLLAATLLNGVALGGILDTGMTLWLNQQYGLDALGAGLVFLGAVVPSIFVRLSPFSPRVTQSRVPSRAFSSRDSNSH
jgi:hypothetical protein